MLPLIPVIAAAATATVIAGKKFNRFIQRYHTKASYAVLDKWLKTKYGVTTKLKAAPNLRLPPNKTPFIVVALESGDQELFRNLLELGADPNTTDNDGTPILFRAMASPCYADLMQYNPDPNRMNAEGKTALFFANVPSHCEAFLKLGAVPNARDMFGRNPLFYAESGEIMKILIQAGANPKVIDMNGETPLHHANTLECVEALLLGGADPNAKNRDGQTFIFKLDPRINKHLKMAQVWNLYGGDPEITDASNRTAEIAPLLKSAMTKLKKYNDRLLDDLSPAIENKDIETVKFLLEQGADPNALDPLMPNWNMLHCAINAASLPIVEELIRFGADVNTAMNHDNALGYALYKSNTDAEFGRICCETLLNHGAVAIDSNLDALYLHRENREKRELIRLFAHYPQSFINASPRNAEMLIKAHEFYHSLSEQSKLLFSCVQSEIPNEYIRLLLARGAKVNAVDKEGKTPLFYARSKFAIQELIKYGANIQHRDLKGRTALFYVKQDEFASEIITALVQHGIDVQAEDADGQKAPYAANINIFLRHGKQNILLDKYVKNSDCAFATVALNRGADPNVRHSQMRKWNMLMLAVVQNDHEMCELLVKHGADPNLCIDGISAMQMAESSDRCLAVLKNSATSSSH